MTEQLEASALAQMLGDLARADLGDPRLVARVRQIVERMAAAPDATLPDALVTNAELEGAYRLFNNRRVSFEQLIDAHTIGTAERAMGLDVVLAIHDTTQCMFRHADPEEVGYLNTGKPGFPLHMTLLVDTGQWRRPLGLTHAEVLPRDHPPNRSKIRRKPRSSYQSAKATDREFLRWQRGIACTEARLTGTGAAVIHVGDRETDSYALMAACTMAGHRFIFRARSNRNVLHDGESLPIRDAIAGAVMAFEREVPLSRRLAATAPRKRSAHPPRESRVARLCFSATSVSFQRPSIASKELPKTIDVHALRILETDPPDGQDAVDWLLYTTEPIDTQKQIEQIVDYYRCRWQIEELNKALKTGCVVQERQLESFDALTTMLALSLPIAVELLAMKTLARADDKAPATEILTVSQLDALRHMSHRPLPAKPTVQDVLWCIAGLGGHIKNNGPAGWQVLQRGMEKYVAFAAGWCAREAADL